MYLKILNCLIKGSKWNFREAPIWLRKSINHNEYKEGNPLWFSYAIMDQISTVEIHKYLCTRSNYWAVISIISTIKMERAILENLSTIIPKQRILTRSYKIRDIEKKFKRDTKQVDRQLTIKGKNYKRIVKIY